MNHYHVLGGLHGCLPNFNEVYDDLETAKYRLNDIKEDFEDSGNKTESSDTYIEIIEKTDSLCDYVEISECNTDSCLEIDD